MRVYKDCAFVAVTGEESSFLRGFVSFEERIFFCNKKLTTAAKDIYYERSIFRRRAQWDRAPAAVQQQQQQQCSNSSSSSAIAAAAAVQ